MGVLSKSEHPLTRVWRADRISALSQNRELLFTKAAGRNIKAKHHPSGQSRASETDPLPPPPCLTLFREPASLTPESIKFNRFLQLILLETSHF